MIPSGTRLTLDDLERLAFTYGGTVEPHGTGYRLVGATIAGVVQDFYAAGGAA